ncbi:extracellular solute-binding protein [Paenibacillus tritici]|uniref:ABC transporter substrate-binding protein n=1 Tax=Paenibacillus tritici TaxID=1873425 RepID=UPI001BA94125|nr:extracellular solute-binding protein [Paenibacillus tritici]QUL52111.1 extracellular solute-binding protein [Paenibacillus tritici]
MFGKKLGLVAASALLCGVALSACGGAEVNNGGTPKPDAKAEGKESVSLWIFDADPMYQAAAEATAAEVGVDLKYEYIQDETYKTKISVALAANELPDVFQQHAGKSYRTPVLQSKTVAPLNDTLDSTGLGAKFLDNQLVKEEDGNIYSVPSNISTTLVFYYNKKLMNDLGATPPATWDDLQAVVSKAEDKGIIPIALGGKERWQGDLLYNLLVARQDVNAFDKALSGQAKFTDAPFVEAAKQVASLVSANTFQKGFLGSAYLDAQELFKNDKALIWIDGSFNFSALSKAMGDNLGYIVFPKTGAEDVYSSTIGFQNSAAPYSLFVNNSSKHLDKAKEFAITLSLKLNDEFVRKGLPGYAASDVKSESQNEQLSTYASDIGKTAKTQAMWFGLLSADIGQEYRDMTQQLYGGNLTPEEYTAQLETLLRSAE